MTRQATTFKPAAGGEDGVIGPINLDIPAAGCDKDSIYGLTKKALEEQGLTWVDDFDHLSLVFPGEKAGCSFGGLGSLGGGVTWLPSGDGTVDQTVISHELGHNLGYGHQMRIRCEDSDLASCRDTPDHSFKTPMGGGGVAVGLTAPELIHAKWLSDKEAVTVAKSGTYTMRSLHGPGDGVRALIVPAGQDSLVVEVRGGSGTLDDRLAGVHAYRVKNGDFGRGATLIDTTPGDDDTLKAGTAFTDKAHKVEIKVEKSGDGAATVAVSLNGVPSPAKADGESGDGAAPQTGSSERVASGDEDGAEGTGGAGGRDGANLAETGADTTDYLPMAAGGAALLAAGGAFLLKFRRKRAAMARHAR
ncbi:MULTISPECIES: LPXTG cell wall anchor domain-containing protein [unclassified Streptomyces]|uniref:LPXTG cell wall anchor domain-containing protein n=1 Tax=unclassified Streptomyces TaxID=2593676 RepID=UPI00131BF98F|nr:MULTISPECIES: LPXTG cell wall anchor domain-containing protein [unclassified Streptomyces]